MIVKRTNTFDPEGIKLFYAKLSMNLHLHMKAKTLNDKDISTFNTLK